MPTCSVCARPDREAIDEALVLGTSQRQIAEEKGLSKDAVRRHRTAHLSPALRKVAETRQTGGARTGVDRMHALAEVVQETLEIAKAQGNSRLLLEAVKRMESIITTLMKVSGELDERPTVQVLNVATSTEWLALRAAVFEALRPYPDARQAVADAISRRELAS